MRTEKSVLDYAYKNWVLEETDARYYGSADDAVVDFKAVFRYLIKEKLYSPMEK